MGDEVQVADDKAIVMESEWRALTRLLRLIGNVKVEGSPDGDTLVLALNRPVWVAVDIGGPNPHPPQAGMRRSLRRIRISPQGLRLQVNPQEAHSNGELWVEIDAIKSVEQWL